MAEHNAGYGKREQRPLFFVSREHLIQCPDQQRKEDHGQALAKRRADIHVGQAIAAQHIEHRCAKRDAAAVHHCTGAEIACGRCSKVDQHFKDAHACCERYAQIAQHGRQIQEDFRIELRRGIAVAQQRGGVDAHGELTCAQACGNAFDAVEMEKQIVSVVDALP